MRATEDEMVREYHQLKGYDSEQTPGDKWTLEWVAISFSTESSQPGDWTLFLYIGRWILYIWDTWEAPVLHETIEKTMLLIL